MSETPKPTYVIIKTESTASHCGILVAKLKPDGSFDAKKGLMFTAQSIFEQASINEGIDRGEIVPEKA